jgi:hypothetical protein
LKTGSTAVLVVFFFKSLSTDQGTTSLLTGSGAIGLLGLWYPGPEPVAAACPWVPGGKGDPSTGALATP